MRGVRERSPAQTESVTAARVHDEQALSMLGEIRDALQELAAQRGAGP